MRPTSSLENTPRIGVIADRELALHLVQSTLLAAGYKVMSVLDANRLNVEKLEQHRVDAWVVELENDSDNEDVIDLLSEIDSIPILMGDGVPPQTEPEAHQKWQRRLKEKLKCMAVAGAEDSDSQESVNPIIQRAHSVASGEDAARHVWVLGASMGGPDAVKAFLDALPDKLPVAFVYAQHINHDHDDLLAQVLGRHNRLRLSSCVDGHALRHGQVTIVPTDCRVRFFPLGKVQRTQQGWEGPFSPNIDQVIEDIALLYKECSGVIIFSGMSNDGAAGVSLMSDNGGEVWAQQPESCVCSSMPEAALQTGCVGKTGTPQELAMAIMQKYANEYVLNTQDGRRDKRENPGEAGKQ